MEQSRLLMRLETIRRTIRRRLVAYGLCAVTAGGVVAVFTAVMLDWLLWLPAPMRMGGAALVILGFMIATWYWVVRPLRASLTVEEVAGKLERHFGHLQDRLSSTVNFLKHPSAGSPAMMRQVVVNTDRLLANMHLESALSLRPLVVRVVWLAIALTVLASVSLVAADWAKTGAFRYLDPLGGLEWPRTVSINPITGHETVAIGESTTLRMEVVRGLHDALRGIVHLREADGATLSLAMQRDADGTFYATIDSVTTDLQYWFEAGDDSTERRHATIRAVRRPEVVQAHIEVHPPPYASDRAASPQVLDANPIEATIGGWVMLTVQASKPIASDCDPTDVGLRLDDGSTIALTPNQTDPRRLEARFEIIKEMKFRIALLDRDGFRNRGSQVYTIAARADTPATVTVLEPKAVVELTPRGSVLLLIRVEDDFGISSLDLEADLLGDAAPAPKRLFAGSLTDRLVPIAEDQEILAMADYRWSIEPMKLAPGDVLVYRAVATDNFAHGGATHHTSRSNDLRIKIISDVEFEIRLRDDLALLETRIRRAMLDQFDMLDRAASLVQRADEPTALDDAQRETSAGLADEETRLVRRVRNLSRRFRAVDERLRQNQIGTDDTRRQVAAVGDELLRIASGPMTSASADLRRMSEQVEPLLQQQAAGAAVREEQVAVDRLQAVIHTMAQWGSYHGLITKSRDLLDRQQAVRSETTSLADSMLGKPVESLTPAQRAAHTRTKRRQEHLADDVEQLLTRMSKLLEASDTTSGDDRAGAITIEQALRAAEGHELLKRLRAAARALGDNRTAAATIDQRAAEDAIRKIIAALNERKGRELAELRKQIRDVEVQLAELIAAQQTIRNATHEAKSLNADAEAKQTLADNQHTVARNARFLGEELGGMVRAAGAARLVRHSAVPMAKAETDLRAGDITAAEAAQDEALAMLKEALDALEELARQTAEEALQRTLAQIRAELEGMLKAQREVNTAIVALRARVDGRKRLSRAEARQASKLARDQAAVRTSVDELRPELTQVVVYDWALHRVADWMDTARRWLDTRKVDDELVATTERIARELNKLIDAIQQTFALSMPTEFTEAETSGGGQGQGKTQAKKPVPTIAELFVLKAMQVDVNRRTRDIHESVDVENATEGQLRELQMIGEDQAEVRRLTHLVTQRARQP